MTACCYAARGKEASDNADRGPQRRRSRAQLRCHSSSLFDGGGREREMVGGVGGRNDFGTATQSEMSDKSSGSR